MARSIWALILIGLISIHATGQTTVVHFAIDGGRDVHPISRFIYGINGKIPESSNLTFERLGGNRLTAFNWVNNARAGVWAGELRLGRDGGFAESAGCDGERFRDVLSSRFQRADVFQLTRATPQPIRGRELILGNDGAISYQMPAFSVSTLRFVAIAR
jgi:hypothetical protein